MFWLRSWVASEGGSSWDIEASFFKNPLAVVGSLEAAGARAVPEHWGRGPYCSLQRVAMWAGQCDTCRMFRKLPASQGSPGVPYKNLVYCCQELRRMIQCIFT